MYCVLGPAQDLLYIGKAGNLHRRLSDWARGTTNPDDVRVHRLVDAVSDVRWFECRDEREALCREADLIVALAPPYNASMRFDVYMFVCVERPSPDRYRLRITEDAPTTRNVYGAFPHLGKGKASWRAVRTNGGYSALIRLLWVALAPTSVRYRLPAKLRGTSPPVTHEIPVDEQDAARLNPELRDFLSGRSERLLRTLSAATTSDELPVFMRSPLADDLRAADEFFQLGPRAVRNFRLRHGLRAGPVDTEAFASLHERELRAAIGDFVAPARIPVARGLSARRRVPSASDA